MDLSEKVPKKMREGACSGLFWLDSRTLAYRTANTIWKLPLTGGEAEEHFFY